MEEELLALEELVRVTAEKYNIYITTCSFYGKGAYLTAQNIEDKGTRTYINL